MSIPSPTENTVTTFLTEQLKKLGVKATPFTSLQTPAGRREVDIVCKNGGLYPCEAKFTESDLLKAISKIQNDYIKYHSELGVKGGFAILYPNSLTDPVPQEVLEERLNTLEFKAVATFLPEDTRKNFTVYKGTLTQIAQDLAENILKPPFYIEPNVEWVIKSLRESANYITIGLRHLAGEQLEDIFGGQHVFHNILQIDEESYPTDELRLASAYLLVNQLLFYHVISRRIEYRDDVPEIDSERLESPSQLKDYFKKILDDVNYKPIFSYDVASRITDNYTDIVRTIINVIQGISPEKIGGDLLGTIFHDLIPLDVRKYVAAYYTNVKAANLLACLSVDRDDKVADLAVGSGGLLVAAYRRKKELLEIDKEFTQVDHEIFLDELLGVDVMPFAASIAASHLALQSPEYKTDKVNLAIWDSTELYPGEKIPSIADLKYVIEGQTNLGMFEEEKEFVRGSISLSDTVAEEIELYNQDVVIMNPPFTRQERIPPEYKDRLNERFEDYQEYLHGQLGFYGYFLLLADKFLNVGGKIAFVLPAAFLRGRNAGGVREFISKNYNVEYIITGRRKLNFSESTWRREILFVAKKLEANEGKRDTAIIGVDDIPESKYEVENLCSKIASISGDYEDYEVTGFTVSPSEIENDLDWFRFIAPFHGGTLSEIWYFIKNSSDNLVLWQSNF